MRWDELGTIATILAAMTVIIPWLVKIFIGPMVDEKVKSVIAALDARFQYVETRINDHIDNHHGRNRK